jgi:uncharacterized protein YkwD
MKAAIQAYHYRLASGVECWPSAPICGTIDPFAMPFPPVFPMLHSRLDNRLLATLLLAGATAFPAHASRAPADLVMLINAYRSAPGTCAGRPATAVAPLLAEPALSRIHIGSGTFLEPALEKAGYRSEHAEALFVAGPTEPEAVMDTLREQYCTRLLSTEVEAAGVIREAGGWHIVLARARPAPLLPETAELREDTLAAVNQARASPRRCGDEQFGRAPPLRLNTSLDRAAFSHSQDMARLRYFSHREGNGSVVGDRALMAGYPWRTIGENIASGQRSAREAVDGWLASPGHCANIMNAAFVEMGIGYAVNPIRGTVYWTQVLGRAR